MSTKVYWLKQLVSKMTGKPVEEIEGESVSDLLRQIAQAYGTGNSSGGTSSGDTGSTPGNDVTFVDTNTIPKAISVVFARKTIPGYGKFIVADADTMSVDLILDDGRIVQAKVEFTDVEN